VDHGRFRESVEKADFQNIADLCLDRRPGNAAVEAPGPGAKAGTELPVDFGSLEVNRHDSSPGVGLGGSEGAIIGRPPVSRRAVGDRAVSLVVVVLVSRVRILVGGSRTVFVAAIGHGCLLIRLSLARADEGPGYPGRNSSVGANTSSPT
jgi:hypothetical protein